MARAHTSFVRAGGARPHRGATVLTLVVAAAALTGSASAAFQSSSSAVSESITTGSLAAPTLVKATCVALSSNVTLTWTATTSTIATGYKIFRSTTNGGPYTAIGTVTGRTTTTYTDTIATLTTQYYVVQATRNNWTSPDSNQSGVQSIALGVCNSV